MALPRAAVTEQDDRVADVQIGAARQRGDRGGVHRGCCRQVEVGQALHARELRLVDSPLASPFGAVVDLGREDLGQEGQVRQPVALGDVGQPGGLGPDRGEMQLPGGGADGGLGGVGDGGHELASSRVS
jgi:hypothetical protein